MNRLIGDLLDVMRIESGRLSLEMEDLRVAARVDAGGGKRAASRGGAPDSSSSFRADRYLAAIVWATAGGSRSFSATCSATRSSSRPREAACRSERGGMATTDLRGGGHRSWNLTGKSEAPLRPFLAGQSRRPARRGTRSADHQGHRRSARRSDLGRERAWTREPVLCRFSGVHETV